MDKQSEIKILQSLKGDTYFNQFFSNEDIDRMCQNITSDLAIESFCNFNQKSVALQARIDAIKEQYREDKETSIEAIVTALDGDIPSELYKVLWDMADELTIIKIKRDKGYELTDAEIDFLIKEASK